MHTPLLTQAELDRVLAPTSPHSFKHNVSLLCAKSGTPTSSEPVFEIQHLDPLMNQLGETVSVINELRSGLSSKSASQEDVVLWIATTLGAVAVEMRAAAAMLGIPLEEVQEALIGAILTSTSVDAPDTAFAAVNTVIYGVKRPRHPYENIQDE